MTSKNFISLYTEMEAVDTLCGYKYRTWLEPSDGIVDWEPVIRSFGTDQVPTLIMFDGTLGSLGPLIVYMGCVRGLEKRDKGPGKDPEYAVNIELRSTINTVEGDLPISNIIAQELRYRSLVNLDKNIPAFYTLGHKNSILKLHFIAPFDYLFPGTPAQVEHNKLIWNEWQKRSFFKRRIPKLPVTTKGSDMSTSDKQEATFTKHVVVLSDEVINKRVDSDTMYRLIEKHGKENHNFITLKVREVILTIVNNPLYENDIEFAFDHGENYIYVMIFYRDVMRVHHLDRRLFFRTDAPLDTVMYMPSKSGQTTYINKAVNDVVADDAACTVCGAKSTDGVALFKRAYSLDLSTYTCPKHTHVREDLAIKNLHDHGTNIIHSSAPIGRTAQITPNEPIQVAGLDTLTTKCRK